jgi:hypothetical protein
MDGGDNAMKVKFIYLDSKGQNVPGYDFETDFSQEQLFSLFNAQSIKYPKNNGGTRSSVLVKLTGSQFDLFDGVLKIDVCENTELKSGFLT